MTTHKEIVEQMKACPFCGCEAHMYKREDTYLLRVECMATDCNAGIDGFDSKECAKQAWNRRTP